MSAAYREECWQKWQQAEQLSKDGKYEECLELARSNLRDPNLPQYCYIRNSLLIGFVEDDWYTAESMSRNVASTLHWTRQLADPDNTKIQALLAEVKTELTALQEHLKKQGPEEVDESLVWPDVEEEGAESQVDQDTAKEMVEEMAEEKTAKE